MPQSIDLQVLARHLDQIATAEDRAAIDTWLHGDPARGALLAQLETAWRADAERLGAPPDASAVWARLSHQLGFQKAVSDRATPAPRVLRLVPERTSPGRVANVVKWAAAIAGVTLAGATTWQLTRARTSETAGATQRTYEYVTPRGQRTSFRLADGSEVMLNAESRLRVPLAFGAPGVPRTVELQGQGYFTVVHDGRRPFVVRTAHGVTRDIGTRFDIRAYPDDSVERVAVTEGEVSVRAAAVSFRPEVSLRAGQMAAIAPNGGVARVSEMPIEQEVAWTQGRLVLREVTMADAARRMGRWYGLDIRIADSALMHRRVSGLYADEPIADVLTVLTATVGARYEWHGRVVTIFLADQRR